MAKPKNLLKKLKLNESTISMILGVLVVLVVGALVINYFRNIRQPKTGQVSEEKPPTEEVKLEDLPTVYKVQAGDSLWKIAEKTYGSGYNWVDIARENNLKNPNLITPGQELTLPKAEVIKPKLAEKTSPSYEEAINGDTYTVVKGDHLWGIAVRAYGDGYQWVKIAHENQLANPNLIHPGNTLKIPR